MQPTLGAQRATRFDEIFPLIDENGPYTTVPFSRGGPRTYWGEQEEEQTVEWWNDLGETSGDILEIPDPDAWYIGDLGFEQTVDTIWQAGGSDGEFNFMVIIDADGDWWVDRFDAGMTTLLGRFRISDWSSWGYFTGDTSYFYQTSNYKCLSANATRIAIVAEYVDYDLSHTVIRVAVLNTDGDTLHDHTIVMPDNDWDFLESTGSSCIGNGKFYFVIHTYNYSVTAVVSVDLDTGADETLFTLDYGGDGYPGVNDIIASGDPTWFSYEFYPDRQTDEFGRLSDVRGLLCVPGSTDLIVSSGSGFGGGGLVRVQADGTPVWWKHE